MNKTKLLNQEMIHDSKQDKYWQIYLIKNKRVPIPISRQTYMWRVSKNWQQGGSLIVAFIFLVSLISMWWVKEKPIW